MFGFGQQKNPQATPMGGLGGFLGNNANMLTNVGLSLLAHRQNSNQTPLTDVAQMATLGSAMDTQKKDRKAGEETKNQTAEWLVKNGYAQDPTEAMMLVQSGAVKDIFAEKFKPKEPEWKVVDGQLVKISGDDVDWLQNPNPGSSGPAELGLTPQYGVDDQGNPVLIQLGKDGRAVQPQMPEGVRLSKEPIKLDAGTHFVLLDPITRQPVGQIEKDIAGAAAQTEIGKAEGAQQAGAEAALAQSQQLLKSIERVRESPGRAMGTGKSRWVDPRAYGAGSPVADFDADLAQLQGQTFMQAYESLKGGGTITEIESMKAEAAIARLQTSQSDEAFLRALGDLEEVVRGAMQKAEQRLQQNGGAAAPAASGGVRRYNQQTGRIE